MQRVKANSVAVDLRNAGQCVRYYFRLNIVGISAPRQAGGGFQEDAELRCQKRKSACSEPEGGAGAKIENRFLGKIGDYFCLFDPSFAAYRSSCCRQYREAD
jgi:hypothetical protein